MEQLIIRKATREDLPSLHIFEQGVITAERPYDNMLKENPIKYYELEEMIDNPSIELVVAVLHDHIIGSGYARIEKAKPFFRYESYAYLGFMYVVPAYRGKGVNQLVIGYLKTWAQQHDIQELRLQVYADNLPAIKAYEKIGFTTEIVEMHFNTNNIPCV